MSCCVVLCGGVIRCVERLERINRPNRRHYCTSTDSNTNTDASTKSRHCHRTQTQKASRKKENKEGRKEGSTIPRCVRRDTRHSYLLLLRSNLSLRARVYAPPYHTSIIIAVARTSRSAGHSRLSTTCVLWWMVEVLQLFPAVVPFLKPFWYCSPVSGTNCMEFECFVRKTGLQFSPKR